MTARSASALLLTALAASGAIAVGLWTFGAEDEWLALALYALGVALLGLVGSVARAADAEDR